MTGQKKVLVAKSGVEIWSAWAHIVMGRYKKALGRRGNHFYWLEEKDLLAIEKKTSAKKSAYSTLNLAHAGKAPLP
jgi:hypothetical protein